MKKWIPICSAVLLAVFTQLAFAHAILMSSTPAIHATVHGPLLNVDLRFNSRVDCERSRVFIVTADGNTNLVPLTKQPAPNRLEGHITLQPGSYTLRWQALAADGHITRGAIPFTVR